MWRVGITVWPSKPLTYLLLNSHLSTDRLAMSLNTKAMVAKHFVKVEGEDSKWACACGKVLVQKVNTGYTNLVSHVRTTHPEWLQQQLATTIGRATTNHQSHHHKNHHEECQQYVRMARVGLCWSEEYYPVIRPVEIISAR